MSRKRKGFRKLKSIKHHPGSRTRKEIRETDKTEKLLLFHLYTASTPLSIKEITTLPELNRLESHRITTSLTTLLQAKLIRKNSRNSYTIKGDAPLYEGTLEQNPRGFGFVTTGNQPRPTQVLAKDIYIPAFQLGQSRHGDRVLVRVVHIKKNGRPEGAVVSVLSHGPDTVAGTLVKQNREYLVYPDDSRFPFAIRVEKPKDAKLQAGDCVVAQYKVSEKPSRVQNGKIIEILGPQKTTATQMRLVVEKFHLPYHFNKETLEEIKNINEDFSDLGNREDLRDIDHVTIDGASARDFDDAVCVTQTKTGYRLYVSIADVSHFVQPGSHIDKEAYARGTSIYFPDAVIPMLPEKLSNDLCSLKPDSDRYTVSAILDFDKNAKLQKQRFCRSIIRSKYRFTYSTVSKILEDKDPELGKRHTPFIAQLKVAEKLASKLKQKRQKRGSVDFNLFEPLFTLTPNGEVASIERTQRTAAHQIIEEFMLAANEAVADYFSKQCSTALYRIHESPDQEKLDQFLKFATSFDLALPAKSPHPKFLAKILDSAKGSRYEYIINNLLLRSLKQAQYSTKNVGHFGLASPNYTHFTSPIRRYPDLLVHRQLISLLTPSSHTFSPKPSLQDSGEFLSTRERQAVLAERDMNNRLKTLYMSKFIGHQFDAIISGVSENNLFIEIQELCVSGAISVEYLSDDYYLFDEKNYRLFGEISARTYQIGDPIKVVLLEVNLNKQQLDFSPAEK